MREKKQSVVPVTWLSVKREHKPPCEITGKIRNALGGKLTYTL